jgi:hypothetical protein
MTDTNDNAMIKSETAEMTPTPGATLCKAMLAAQKQAQAVDKGSVNSFHRYKYASAEAIIAEARQALTSAGIVVSAIGWSSDGNRVAVKYLVAHESGECIVSTCSTAVVPDKGRPLDKAESTALTYNLGYFLRGFLLLPRVDPSAEVDSRDDRRHAPAIGTKLGNLGVRIAGRPQTEADKGGNGEQADVAVSW